MFAKLVFSMSLLLAATSLWAQSDLNIDLTPDQILTGDADAALQELGAKAAAEGATLVVTAPDYWHELIGEQIIAGAGDAGVDIEFKDSFIEAAWVRSREAQRAAAVESPAPAPVEPEPVESTVAAPPPEVDVSEPAIVTSAPAPQAVEPQVDTSALAEQARVDAINSLREDMRPPSQDDPAEQEAVQEASQEFAQEAAPVEPEPEAAAPVEVAPVEVAVVEPEPAQNAPVEPVSASPDDFQADSTQDPGDQEAADSAEQAVLDIASYRADLEERVNFGRPIRRDIALEDVRAGDELFVSGPAVAVVRRSKAGISTFWLGDNVDLDSLEVSEIQNGRYLVEVSPGDEPVEVAVAEPVPTESESDRMEQRYNRGRTIRDDLDASLLRENDLIYTSENMAVVIRREQIRAKAYWLTGEIDLNDVRIRKEGSNKYRILRDF